ncbi:MAG TPA: hypothetical protein PLE21_00325 [Giesbergeria sp.]|nr:hypothetical protein [Giesbergeria sp.]
MRLTVLEFAERYRIKEADASKLLRRAALDERLEVSYDGSYKATYSGSSERYLELSREYRERKPQRRPSRPRTLLERTQPVARPSPWAGLLP